MKNYKDVETGKIFQELSHSIFYDFEKNEIMIIRESILEEEKGIPSNNDYP